MPGNYGNSQYLSTTGIRTPVGYFTTWYGTLATCATDIPPLEKDTTNDRGPGMRRQPNLRVKGSNCRNLLNRVLETSVSNMKAQVLPPHSFFRALNPHFILKFGHHFLETWRVVHFTRSMGPFHRPQLPDQSRHTALQPNQRPRTQPTKGYGTIVGTDYCYPDITRRQKIIPFINPLENDMNIPEGKAVLMDGELSSNSLSPSRKIITLPTGIWTYLIS